MVELAGRRILLGVTGGIAAYKSAELVRLLIKAGAEVRVAMTAAAREFVTPLTFQALSGNPVHEHLLNPAAEAGMGHIELARWADLVLIAPASADFLARLCHGHANDLLTTTCLATTAPIAVAPAMNQAMWSNPLTQRNLGNLTQTLSERLHCWGPDAGSQACGDVGPGRMQEPAQLCDAVIRLFAPRTLLMGRRVVLTAGPTREGLDPVRFITNHSSGKMGYALAAALRQLGADVTLISGPVNLAAPAGVQRVSVTSALEMLAAVEQQVAGADIFVATAAVADYRPLQQATQKIKKSTDTLSLELVKNPDIVATVARRADKPFTVGFAAETQDVAQYAAAKLKAKGLDLIVANDVSRSDIGFNADDNAVTLLWPDGREDLEKMPKERLAGVLAERIAALFLKANP